RPRGGAAFFRRRRGGVPRLLRARRPRRADQAAARRRLQADRNRDQSRRRARGEAVLRPLRGSEITNAQNLGKGKTMRVYYDRDADLNLIKGKKVAIIGYGSQG